MRIGQTAHVEHQIRVQGNAVLVAEGLEQKHRRFSADVQPFLDPVAQHVRQQIGRVEAVADFAHGGEDLALARQGLLERARPGRQRMAPACFGEAPDQGIVFRIEEEQAQSHALSFQRRHVFRDELERIAHAGVDAHSNMVVAGAAEQFRRLLEQLPREIVDAVVTAVLEGIERDALAGAREAADEHELHLGTLAFFHLRTLSLHELFRRVNAAKLQDVVAHGGLEQHREIATRGDRNDDFPDGHAQDIFRLFVQRESLRLVRPRAIEMHDQPQVHLRAHRGLAEYRADVEHAQAAHLQKILQYRRAAAFERGHRDARDVDDIVRNEPVAAADQFQRELAFPGARIARDEHAESEHVHAYPVALHRFRERFAEITTQTLDDLRAGHIGGEHRRARSLGRLEQTHVCGRSFGDDDGYRVDREQIAEHLEQFGLLERGEVSYLVIAEDLDAVGMDEIEMAYECRDAGAVAPQPSRAAGL